MSIQPSAQRLKSGVPLVDAHVSIASFLLAKHASSFLELFFLDLAFGEPLL